MPFNLLFKQAFIWGAGAQVGATLIQGITATAKVVYKKKKDKNSTK
jgi:hypothetical protein